MKNFISLFTLLLAFSTMFASGPVAKGVEMDTCETVDALEVPMDIMETLEENDYHLVTAAIKTKEVEVSRFRVARHLIQSEYLLTTQVLGIMMLFEHENTRLKFAKEAYSAVVDPDRFETVAEAFGYEASEEKLDDYLSRYDSTMALPRIKAADATTFKYTQRKMMSSTSDKARLQIAKGSVANEYLDCVQVAQMLETFDTDRAKVEFATYSYTHVIDPYNFSGMDFLYSDKDNYELVEAYIRRK